MNLFPLAQKMEVDGLGILGETIFINMIPAECKQGILLRNPLRGTKIDYELPGYYKAKFQLIVRSQSYDQGDELINAAFTSLTLSDVVVGTMAVQFMRPLTKPVVFPLSKGNLLEFAADFETVFTE